eukprot:scaffold7821_cov99-Isochrysis_galbana.AAC.6
MARRSERRQHWAPHAARSAATAAAASSPVAAVAAAPRTAAALAACRQLPADGLDPGLVLQQPRLEPAVVVKGLGPRPCPSPPCQYQDRPVVRSLVTDTPVPPVRAPEEELILAQPAPAGVPHAPLWRQPGIEREQPQQYRGEGGVMPVERRAAPSVETHPVLHPRRHIQQLPLAQIEQHERRVEGAVRTTHRHPTRRVHHRRDRRGALCHVAEDEHVSVQPEDPAEVGQQERQVCHRQPERRDEYWPAVGRPEVAGDFGPDAGRVERVGAEADRRPGGLQAGVQRRAALVWHDQVESQRARRPAVSHGRVDSTEKAERRFLVCREDNVQQRGRGGHGLGRRRQPGTRQQREQQYERHPGGECCRAEAPARSAAAAPFGLVRLIGGGAAVPDRAHAPRQLRRLHHHDVVGRRADIAAFGAGRRRCSGKEWSFVLCVVLCAAPGCSTGHKPQRPSRPTNPC